MPEWFREAWAESPRVIRWAMPAVFVVACTLAAAEVVSWGYPLLWAGITATSLWSIKRNRERGVHRPR